MDWMSEGTNTHEIKKKNIYIYIYSPIQHAIWDAIRADFLCQHSGTIWLGSQWGVAETLKCGENSQVL